VASHPETRINETLLSKGEAGRVDVSYDGVTDIFIFERV